MNKWFGERKPVLLREDGWRASAYLLVSLSLVPLYLVPFLLMVTGVIGIAAFLIGLTLIPVATFAARWAVRLDRAALLIAGVQTPDPAPTPGLRGFVDGRAWRAFAHSIAIAFWSLGVGTLVTALLLIAFTLVNMPWIATMIPIDYANIRGFPISYGASVVGIPLGLLLATGTLHLARWAVLVRTTFGRWIQGEDETVGLQRRIATLESTRAALVDAAAGERARIERNLHDGAQQRLLTVALAVSRAKRLGDTDMAKTRQLLDTAQAEATAAVQELRAIARGAHPPILTERGLVAAIVAAAGRHPSPVELDIDLPERPSRRIEAMGYYVVSEALANAAKHAGAAPVTIKLSRIADASGDQLEVRIIDEGMGGAELTANGGLTGLADRVHAVDGIFEVESPPGGPTEVRAILPWEP
ncbi:histidine kinase [Micromonospora inaquosa]|uniref:sensor histidine kinase n=1 Tax=Micromonospora inaquosa TaxID=2203716 RepID=UPI0033F5424D